MAWSSRANPKLWSFPPALVCDPDRPVTHPGNSAADLEHGTDAPDDRADRRRGVETGGCVALAFLGLRLVDGHHHHVTRIGHRKAGKEGVDAHILVIGAVDDLLRRAGLAADIEPFGGGPAA